MTLRLDKGCPLVDLVKPGFLFLGLTVPKPEGTF